MDDRQKKQVEEYSWIVDAIATIIFFVVAMWMLTNGFTR